MISRTIPESTSPETSIEGHALWLILGITMGLVAAAGMVWLLLLAFA